MMWTTNPWSTTGGPFFCWEDSCERSLLASNEKFQWTKYYPLHCLHSLVRLSAREFQSEQGVVIPTEWLSPGNTFPQGVTNRMRVQGLRVYSTVCERNHNRRAKRACLLPILLFEQEKRIVLTKWRATASHLRSVTGKFLADFSLKKSLQLIQEIST